MKKFIKNQKGFVLVLVLSLLTLSVIAGMSFCSLTYNEIRIARTLIDKTKAFYIAESGLEDTCAYLKAQGDNQAGVWESYNGHPLYPRYTYRTLLAFTRDVGDGSYTARAYTKDDSVTELSVESTGTVNNSSVTIITTYSKGPKNPFENALAAGGDITLLGHRQKILFLWKNSWVEVNGPVTANGTITTNERVMVNGTQTPSAQLPMPQFIETKQADLNGDGITETYQIDLNRDGSYNPDPSDINYDTNPINQTFYGSGTRVDKNGDGNITKGDNPYSSSGDTPENHPYQDWNAEFDADDVIDDEVITEKDGFKYYYTNTLNNRDASNHLDIGVGESNYYSGDQSFGPLGSEIDPDTNIVFVEGDATVYLNAQSWWDGSKDLAIVSTGDATVVQPTTGSDDRLTVISYGNIYTGGLDIFGLLDGNSILYSYNDINAYYGGVTTGAMVAGNNAYVDTVLTSFLGFFNRTINYNADMVVAPPPIGMPEYPYIAARFKIGSRLSWKQE